MIAEKGDGRKNCRCGGEKRRRVRNIQVDGFTFSQEVWKYRSEVVFKLVSEVAQVKRYKLLFFCTLCNIENTLDGF